MNPLLQAYDDAANRAATLRRPLLLSHTKPDGDAFGSLVAARELLRTRGADPLAVSFDPLPRTYSVFARFEPVHVLGRDVPLADLDRCDGVILLDTGAWNQLLPLEAWLRASSLPRIIVDHHVTRDIPADAIILDESAAATCLILYHWADHQGWTLSPDAAAAIFIGIATDTGWFTHSNTTPDALAAAARIAALGVAPNEMYQRLYQTDDAARLRLRAAALSTIEFAAQDRLAILSVDQATLARVGATLADTENLINDPLSVRSVVVSVLLAEQKSGPVRVSFRSKAPLSGLCDLDMDVAAAAAGFGGGGHRRAAGARVEGPLPEVKRLVVSRLTRLIEDADAARRT
ncbi:MAG: DHH family phosphoesterase [Phycisphaerae bacterium]|nr:MAG: hypothetical protein EDS66_05335 [Planctomycetota bacterium]KAB2949438.1 MAG: hypothetical protein F9K17_03085 [Phycisphaerae bacterium]MBE7458384.1 DHH family phosphoesterase [Planctomycetia bacterium]MCK6465198.1 DHH family phosphoesterase [Phycisphaerae bacterium]MCL4718807.1 DHH family phosphoesterase [Phycisphaerae bacterium]